MTFETQFTQDGVQHLWGLITGSIAGLIDGLLIVVAYLLYPIVVVVFGFFYMFYGSILYIFGPIVIALMPLGGANRLAKSYIENIFIWNAWPILLWRLWRTAHSCSDGPAWADAKPKQLSRWTGEPRRIVPDRHREHRLLSGDRRYSVHCETNRERGCREYSSGDGGYGSHCADRRSGRD